VGDLFKASAPNTGQAFAGYRVALGTPTAGHTGGQLLLNGAAVPANHGGFFTADEFSHLTYVTGDDGSQQSLVAVAVTGNLTADGTLSRETDSQAVQITANVTGSRSINAMNALAGNTVTGITGADADVLNIAQGAAVFTGFVGSARPTLQTDGNFTAVSGDIYRVGDLFKASAPNTGQAIAGYRVALGAQTAPGLNGGQLLLNGAAVPANHGSFFTADEFANLTYVTGDDGSQQSLVAVAVTGNLMPDGTLSRETDSQAVQITADVSGGRSINAMNALVGNTVTGITGADADVLNIAQGAVVFTGFVGSARPTLQTEMTPELPLRCPIWRMRQAPSDRGGKPRPLRKSISSRSTRQRQAAQLLQISLGPSATPLLPRCFCSTLAQLEPSGALNTSRRKLRPLRLTTGREIFDATEDEAGCAEFNVEQCWRLADTASDRRLPAWPAGLAVPPPLRNAHRLRGSPERRGAPAAGIDKEPRMNRIIRGFALPGRLVRLGHRSSLGHGRDTFGAAHQYGCLGRLDCAARSDGQGDRRHAFGVRQVGDDNHVVFAEAVPCTDEFAARGLAQCASHGLGAVLRVFELSSPGGRRIGRLIHVERHRFLRL
jgi:hypothetical protein